MEKTNKIAIIGNFDGIHIGHRRILWYALTKGKELQYDTVAISFSPHPQSFFGKKLKLIQPIEDKIKMIKEMGIGDVSLLNFKDVVDLTPEEFINYLLKKHNIKMIVVGEEFRFGKNRKGDLKTLKRIGKKRNFIVKGIKVFRIFGEKVSSSKIREYLESGNLQRARLMLGGYYTYESIVIPGKSIGTKLGFPTSNLTHDNNFLLREGVYITKTLYKNRYYNSLTHIGSAPTFSNSKKNIETYIFDFNKNIYGEKIKIFFIKYLRDIKKFKNTHFLKKAIEDDFNYTQNFLNTY